MKQRPILFILMPTLLWMQLVLAQTAINKKHVPTQINVEIDWMDNGSHSHQPSTSEIDAVVQMFACQGITLNVDISNSQWLQASFPVRKWRARN